MFCLPHQKSPPQPICCDAQSWLGSVRNGISARFVRQVRITFYDTFLYAKNIAPGDSHYQLREIYGGKCTHTQMVQRVQRSSYKASMMNSPGRPSVSDETIVKVEEAILKYRGVTVRELSETTPDASKTSIDKILIDHLGYAKVCV